MLTDTGPLVALLDPDDDHHAACAAPLRRLRGVLLTAWPVLTEVMYLLRRRSDMQDEMLLWIARGELRLVDLQSADLPRIRELMATYRDLPMDFTDAALVRIAERDGHRRIFTTDRRHFEVYRLKSPGRGREKFAIVP